MSPRSLAAALLAAAVLLSGAGDALAKPTAHTVVIDGLKYVPETLVVNRGDTVTWINNDPFPHTVTAPGVFDSHAIAADGKWKYVARKQGSFDYICTLHPNMKGKLQVE